MGPIALGGAVATGPGRLPYRIIIHVAAINLLWQASEKSIATATTNALELARSLEIRSLAFPILGAGSGGFNPVEAERIMREVIEASTVNLDVVLVRYGTTSPRT